MDSLVSTDWLVAELGSADLCIIDASWHLDAKRDPAADYEMAHIPGAVFMDLAGLADTTTDLPMMVPSSDDFAAKMQALGVGDRDRIVIYDDSDLHSSTRAWWMVRLFGASSVALLDGGLKKWTVEGRPLEHGKGQSRHRPFSVHQTKDAVRTKAQMLDLITSKAEQIVDARGAGRFEGRDPEPRPGMAAGHIPGSRNVPMTSLFNADGTWKRNQSLRDAFAAGGVDPMQPIAATCGSGVTATALAFGAHMLGNDRVAIYDGSWSEWGADISLPKAKGPA